MVTIYMKNDILSMHRQGKSQREISRKLGISRNTVSRYINEFKLTMRKIENEVDPSKRLILQSILVGKPKRVTVTKKRTFVGDLKVRFEELIELDEKRDKLLSNNKQRITASYLHRRLIAEGYQIGLTTVANHLREYRDRKKEVYIKQSYEPGYRAEYDFHEIKVIIAGKKRVIHQATITLPYSNMVYSYYYENQKFESFIDSIVRFFEEIDGVVSVMFFDNMRNVVKRFLEGYQKEYNEELIKLSNYYGFEIKTTNPYRGNEKGHVEVSGKKVRLELFTLDYEFNSLDELKEYANNELKKLNKVNEEKFIEEKEFLKESPKVRYELGRIVTSTVNKESLISVDGSYYSVPEEYALKKVTANIYIGQINIYNLKHELIASHKRTSNKGEYQIEIKHYIETFKKKPGALTNSLALKQSPKIYQELFYKYFSTNIKEYLTIIAKKDIYQLIEILDELNKGKRFLEIKEKTSIEEVSINQLNKIAELFNQGEIRQ